MRIGPILRLAGRGRCTASRPEWRAGRNGSVPFDWGRSIFIHHTVKKSKGHRAAWGVLVGCSSPLLRPWARRWINHLSLLTHGQCDARPTVTFPVATGTKLPNYSSWWQRHMCVNNLPNGNTIIRMVVMAVTAMLYLSIFIGLLHCDCLLRSLLNKAAKFQS